MPYEVSITASRSFTMLRVNGSRECDYFQAERNPKCEMIALLNLEAVVNLYTTLISRYCTA